MLLEFITDKFKTQEVCSKAVDMKRWTLCFASDQCKGQEMSNKFILEDP